MTDDALRQLSFKNPIIIYDGVCHLCDSSIKFIVNRDKKAVFLFSTTEYILKNKLIEINSNSVTLFEDGKTYEKSEAVIRILEILGHAHTIFSYLLRLIPAFLRNKGYDILAKNRYRWFGRYNHCPVPDISFKKRIIG